MKQLHCTCKNFRESLHDTGVCRLDDNPVKPKQDGCKDWGELSERELLAQAVVYASKVEAGLPGASAEHAKKLQEALFPETAQSIIEEQLVDADSPENVRKLKAWAKIEAGIYPEKEKKETCGVCKFFSESEDAEDDEGVEGYCQKNDEATNSDDEGCDDFEKVQGEELRYKRMKEALRTANAA